jgi:hypothetical protein
MIGRMPEQELRIKSEYSIVDRMFLAPISRPLCDNKFELFSPFQNLDPEVIIVSRIFRATLLVEL